MICLGLVVFGDDINGTLLMVSGLTLGGLTLGGLTLGGLTLGGLVVVVRVLCSHQLCACDSYKSTSHSVSCEATVHL